jgi:hypothetical protein
LLQQPAAPHQQQQQQQEEDYSTLLASHRRQQQCRQLTLLPMLQLLQLQMMQCLCLQLKRQGHRFSRCWPFLQALQQHRMRQQTRACERSRWLSCGLQRQRKAELCWIT